MARKIPKVSSSSEQRKGTDGALGTSHLDNRLTLTTKLGTSVHKSPRQARYGVNMGECTSTPTNPGTPATPELPVVTAQTSVFQLVLLEVITFSRELRKVLLHQVLLVKLQFLLHGHIQQPIRNDDPWLHIPLPRHFLKPWPQLLLCGRGRR